MKIKSVKKKVEAKVAKAKVKIASKCKKAAKAVVAMLCLSVLFSGCQGTSTPSRSQNLTIKDCTINVYGCGTETQTSSPTQTTDVKPDIDVKYNDAIAGASVASKGVLETLTSAGANAVLELMSSKKTGTVEVTKTDGSTATVECKDGQCSFCSDCTPAK